ncbi:iron-containing alcohol dehydrogenase [Billgrantia gudaonensis]|uniref:Alcohol dehydrogenase, class IV n=1 Tax=Billgrantia gudaonensis TaxID=376427 RepID=A0A1G9E7U9_9GAMM|nr:iron-containing alcohol dehydrogenase [Halomonas gudaonensis]SDK72135.1 Alcohol dehydrogenase, class IV [Halomonas gudaonensis]
MSIAGQYEFLAQDRVVFGVPAARAVMEQAECMGAKRVFLVSSQTLSRKTDEIDRIRDALGERFVGLFDECVAHVPRNSVLRAAAAVRQADPDLIVTVGGGTPVDTVKVLLICLAHDLQTPEQLDYYRVRVGEDGAKVLPEVASPPLRQIIVPTTLSGAEFSKIGGATDPVREVKDLYIGREIGGQAVILDAAITMHTPDWLWLSTGLRAVDHAVETICSRAPQPFTDATCLHGLRMLNESLRINRERPENLDARLQSQLGVWLASTGLGRVDWGASHGIGHQLGAVAGVPHGYCSCVMLPSVLRYNHEVNADRQRLISEALGQPEVPAADLVAALIKDLGLPTRLRDVGVKREHFDAIARGGMQNMMVRSNPRLVSCPEDILEILELAW